MYNKYYKNFVGDFMNENGLRAVTNSMQYIEGDKKSIVFKQRGLAAVAPSYVTSCELHEGAPYFVYSDINVGYIDEVGKKESFKESSLEDLTLMGIRPILDYSNINLPTYRLERHNLNKFNLPTLQYGFFPTMFSLFASDMEAKRNKNELIETVHHYTKTGQKYDELGYDFEKTKEYKAFGDHKFFRVEDANSKINWYSVRQLDWYVDEENKILISDDILFALELTKNLNRDDIINYINNYFLKEIIQNETIDLVNSKNKTIVIPSNYNLDKSVSSTKQSKNIDYEQQVSIFMNLDVEPLELNSLSITVFGSNLKEHAKAISDASLKIIDMMDNESVYNIKGEIEKLNKNKSSNFIFSKKYSALEIVQNNKKVLTNIEQSLNGQQEIMLEQVKILNYAKKLTALFVNRLNDYILKIKNALALLKVSSNLNKFENADIVSMRAILENKLQDYEKAVEVHTIQYENIDLLFRNYAISLNKMMTYSYTLLPSLFTAVAVSSGILAQKESLDSIKEIDMLLDNVIESNKTYLTNNRKIENLDEAVHNMLVNENLIQSSDTAQIEDISNYKRLIKK